MKFAKIEMNIKAVLSYLFWVQLAMLGLGLSGNNGLGGVGIASATPLNKITPKPTLPSGSGSSGSGLMKTPAPYNYVRKSRETATSSPEAVNPGQEQFVGLPSSSSFRYPSFQHKYQTRMARFHEGQPATRTYSIRSMTSFPKLSPLASMLSAKSSEVNRHPPATAEEHYDDSQEPTFTPFISARALSNIPQFFQHLRDNLEALRFDDEEDEDDLLRDENDRERAERLLGQSGNDMYEDLAIPNIPHGQDKPLMRWMPSSAGGLSGRSHVRHFVAPNPEEQDLFYKKPTFYNPARNVYEFGLG